MQDKSETGKSSSSDPSLLEECTAMCGASVVAPAMTNIRTLARAGKIPEEDADKVLTLPVTFATVVEVFLNNKDAVLEEFKKDPAIPFHVSCLSTFQQDFDLNGEVVVFDDEYKQSELVYGISVNRVKKRICLFFRGSITLRDYRADFRVSMKKFQVSEELGKRVFVHAGFSEYLFQKEEKTGESKIEAIEDHLRTLYEQYPDYRLYVTGQSLGGSLAILSTFYLAARSTAIPGPITLMPAAPLLVGNLSFQRAFQVMEKKKLIRCLCIMNNGDLIPRFPLIGGLKFYCDVGNRLEAYPDRKFKLSGPRESRSYFEAWLRDLPKQAVHIARLVGILLCRPKFWKHHSMLEICGNLSGAASDLEKLSWDAIYKRRGLID